ncbi:MAG: hypothetical protein M3Q55_16530 [Acidobacteriota bacterium]|nr:hypothetical protein [Acidobacteriota bacterium]
MIQTRAGAAKWVSNPKISTTVEIIVENGTFAPGQRRSGGKSAKIGVFSGRKSGGVGAKQA